MKITNGIGYEANKYIDKTTANQEREADKQSIQNRGNAPKSDAVVNLSQASKEIQIAQKVIEETPDIRVEKVEAIKAQVNNNAYKIDYDKVAEKILGTMIDRLV
jgi:negative regulator of flagellin synthesis FlgM